MKKIAGYVLNDHLSWWDVTAILFLFQSFINDSGWLTILIICVLSWVWFFAGQIIRLMTGLDKV